MSANFDYIKPSSLQDAIQFANANAAKFRFIAGGTDVMVNKFQGNEESGCLVDLSGLNELKKIEQKKDALCIGSLVTLEEIATSEIVRREFNALADAAESVASPVLRKTATIGGNLLCENRCVFYNQSEWWREAAGYCLKCNGDICIATGGRKNCFSKFVSDTAPVLISLDAQLEIAGKEGITFMPVQDLYTGDGVNPRKLTASSVICSIVIPTTKKYSCAFRKLRPREAVDFTSLTTAISVCEGEIKIVLGGVDPKPVILTGSTSDDIDALLKNAVKKPRVIDNDYYSRSYRKKIIAVFIEESLKELGVIR